MIFTVNKERPLRSSRTSTSKTKPSIVIRRSSSTMDLISAIGSSGLILTPIWNGPEWPPFSLRSVSRFFISATAFLAISSSSAKRSCIKASWASCASLFSSDSWKSTASREKPNCWYAAASLSLYFDFNAIISCSRLHLTISFWPFHSGACLISCSRNGGAISENSSTTYFQYSITKFSSAETAPLSICNWTVAMEEKFAYSRSFSNKYNFKGKVCFTLIIKRQVRSFLWTVIRVSSASSKKGICTSSVKSRC